MSKVPVSPNEQTGGLYYFARMVDKIRLHQAGELREDLHANLGLAMDDWCCQFLRVAYADVVEQVRSGASTEEVWDWCLQNGYRPSAQEIKVWNAYISRVGWRDDLSDKLAMRKEQSGMADRHDIQTMFDYIDADEGRG
jgi:hypothetical protein